MCYKLIAIYLSFVTTGQVLHAYIFLLLTPFLRWTERISIQHPYDGQHLTDGQTDDALIVCVRVRVPIEARAALLSGVLVKDFTHQRDAVVALHRQREAAQVLQHLPDRRLRLRPRQPRLCTTTPLLG